MAKGKGGTPAELMAAFRRKNFAPLYCFYGPEDYLIDECVGRLIEEAVDASSRAFNLDVVHGSAADGREVVPLIGQFPMMADRRVVVVREFDKLANKELLLPVVERPVPSTVAVFIAAKPDLRLKLFKAMEEQGAMVEFKQLWENEIPPWVTARVRERGKTIAPEAAQLVQGYAGRSLREVANEIDKLFTYVGGRKTIEPDDVHAVVGMSRQYNIFELQRALGDGDLGRALGIGERMIDAGESPIGMIVMLTRWLQKVWILQEAAPGGGGGGIPPFLVREYTAAARRFAGARIDDCFEALLEADKAMKLSGDPHVVMTVMLHRMLRGGL